MTVTTGATPIADCGGGGFIIATTTNVAGRGGIITGQIATTMGGTDGATMSIAPIGTIAAGDNADVLSTVDANLSSLNVTKPKGLSV
jgi:hypothetical protein